MKLLRIAFMGTPEFSILTLEALIRSKHNVVQVYSQPPKPVGRNYKLTKTAVHRFAEANSVPVRTPKTLRDDAEIEYLKSLELDVIVVVAYGLILPKAVLDIPKYGCVNVHASLLPRWRGAAPINRAIEAGDKKSGATLMLMDEGLDTGPMLCSDAFDVDDRMTASQLHDRISQQGSNLIVPTIESYVNGVIVPCQQPEVGITYAHKLNKEEGYIADWSQSAEVIARKVLAFNPWPGVWFSVGNDRIKVLEAEAVDGDGDPGAILVDPLRITCGIGALRIKLLQKSGGKPVDDKAFLNGFSLPEKL